MYEISYANMVLYGATLPTYGGSKTDKKKGGSGKTESDQIIRADDPKNKELVKAIINGYKF